MRIFLPVVMMVILGSGCTSAPPVATVTVFTSVAANPAPTPDATGSDLAAAATPTALPSPIAPSATVLLSAPTLSAAQSTTTTATRVAALPVVTASPAFGAHNLSPSAPITITVARGAIKQLTLTNPTGKTVRGAIAADGRSWTVGEVLGFGKTYTATGTAVGQGGSVPIRGTFSTVPKEQETDSSVTPADGDTVGIAQSVIISFPVEPQDRGLIEKHLTVTTTPKVAGSWAWIHHDTAWGVDWRPKDYWPAGTKVHVTADLYGLKYAAGKYGASDLAWDFTIGRAQVVYADVPSHQIVVKQGCTHAGDAASCTSTSATYPASFGTGEDDSHTTRSGIHVVNKKKPATVMVGGADDPYHATEYWDVRISDNGEFIHENPASVKYQGNSNVSHGCINLSPANAKAYYASVLLGDPVEVTGTNIALSASDGDLFDWTVPWSEWQQLSALN